MVGCESNVSTKPPVDESDDIIIQDLDGDGYEGDNDCDDNNASINIDAIEVCDGIDNNCDGQVDEGVLSTFFADADGDGFGDVDAVQEAAMLRLASFQMVETATMKMRRYIRVQKSCVTPLTMIATMLSTMVWV